jgi:integrase
VEGLPKADGSVRDIDLLNSVYEVVRHHRADTWMRGDYAFVNREGRLVDITTLRRAGLRRRTLHQIRHTYATLQLGHTSTQMLFQRYAKFVPNVTHRNGTALLQAYQGWFNGQEGGRVEMGPLGTLYDTCMPPQQKRG